jgi:UPF0755 protein
MNRKRNELRKSSLGSRLTWKHVTFLVVLSIASIFAFVNFYGFDLNVLLTFSFYENLANPSVKIVRFNEGLRKEEIAEILKSKLGWSELEKNTFLNAHLALNTRNLEGKYFPKTYMIHKDLGPIEVTETMIDEFDKQTKKVSNKNTKKITNPDTALKIASIIQRESGGKSDMRLISGIIWNRLFRGMKLQMDATLQYAKGNEDEGWWLSVRPEDKKINSPYNTYANAGLPPSPIANPGLAAIEAAYNPQKTSCFYYLHDKRGRIHCSATYDEHKRKINIYY